jgi:hypothetical protein
VDAATATEAPYPKKKERSQPNKEKKEDRTLEEMLAILKEKIRAKTELRTKLGLLGGHLRLTGEKCDTGVGKEEEPETGVGKEEPDTDVGVLSCKLATHYCLEDLLSSTGGVCAEVVPGKEAGLKEVAGVAGEEVVLGDVGEVSSVEVAPVVAVNASLKGVDYGDVIDARVISGELDFDEDGLGVEGDEKDDVNHIKAVKLLTLKDKLDIKHLLEEKSEAAGSSREECTPQSNGDFIIDAGILSGCKKSDHFCVPDASSSEGGTCLDINLVTSDIGGGFDERVGSHRYLADHLTQCVYHNVNVGMTPGWYFYFCLLIPM